MVTFRILSFDRHTYFQPIYLSFECIHISFFGNGVHKAFNCRAQIIPWNIYSSWHVLLFISEKEKKVTGWTERMGQNTDLFFFFKNHLTIWDLCTGALSWRSRMMQIPDFVLFLFLKFLNFPKHINFVYMSDDWSAFWKRNLFYKTFTFK